MVDAELPQFLVVLDAQPIEQHVFQFGSGALREL
jgi:hypothetical protein